MLSQGLELSQKQTLRLSTRMLQSLELMMLPVAELRQRIENELLENPTLVAQDRDPSFVSYEEYSRGQIQRENRKEDYSDSSAYGSDLSDSHNAWLEGTLSEKETLEDHLMWQLGCSECSEGARQTAALIISALDESGFLSRPVDEIVDEAHRGYVDEALALVHTFDPVGIAATDFRDSLMIQARAYGLDDDELKILHDLVYDELERLKAGRYDEVAKRLSITRDDLDDLYAFLKTLTPYPASAFGSSQERYIVPDVSIKVEDGRLVTRLNDEAIPLLSLDTGYQQMEKDLSAGGTKQDKEAARYLKKELQSAQELIRQIDMRNSTLEKVAQVLALKQKAFFLFGPGSLKPLTLKDVAVEIGVHEATVSRVTSGKYADTDWGIIPLKSLFSSAVRTTGGQEDMSKEAVKEMVRRIIQDNDTGRPLSDQKISDILKARGVSCARRTVNKYRKELDIDSSLERAR